jgi:hypothetical protein
LTRKHPFKGAKTKKATELDGVNMKLLKYGLGKTRKEFLELYKQC